MDTKNLSDIEVAVLTFAIEAEHDHQRHSASYLDTTVECAATLREELKDEYQIRKLHWTLFGKE